MEPNNFEKDFREKLKQRTIEPSDKAWDRLDAMLSIAEKKEPVIGLRSLQTSGKKWIYIAASIVGFLLVGTFFFNQKKSVAETPKNNVVIKENTKKDSVAGPTLNIMVPAKTEVAVSEKASKHKLINQGNNHPNILVPNSNKNIKKESNQIAESSIIKKNNQEKQSITNQTAIAETSKKETVDQLLESAEKSVVAENSVKPKSKVKINANDLLNQVDGELELSFREKMITKVNKNYQTVKVALANRNQQE
ncbi:hypothetical protein BC749_1011355 [Flavobacterium araucananum]|uniref:Uncharacterized protein n=1 Tax=Flavobacterium araucananum TaxID=946678 RepID=A0A227NUZ0_9FLAO|nr:hypothetical protein [Flavobacterium araucananum]OXG00838.1 hypothetical protein B0A64_19645 [Flavobacterium araucananum]PWK03257.1 hypothetical protein BC749_1011355 [Flavobacterium araucananum]